LRFAETTGEFATFFRNGTQAVPYAKMRGFS